MSDMEKTVQVEPVRGAARQEMSAPERFQSVLAKALGFEEDPVVIGESMGEHDIELACDNTGKAVLEKFVLDNISDAVPGQTKSSYVRLIRKDGLRRQALSRTGEDVIVFMATTSPTLSETTEAETIAAASSETTEVETIAGASAPTAAESTAREEAIAAAIAAAEAIKEAAIAAADAQYAATLNAMPGAAKDEEVSPRTPTRRPATTSGSSPSSMAGKKPASR